MFLVFEADVEMLDDLIMTAKIALAHLNEFPNYYNKQQGLRVFEEFLKTKLIDS